MKARAPGKLVISGAYAVLRGAPALVTAVDRYVVADDATTASHETREVAAALTLLGKSGPHPGFTADALREGDRKLGLGSSAAICAASVALLERQGLLGKLQTPADLGGAIYELTLRAHKKAQGGGSGIDVAAACFGGTLRATLRDLDGAPELRVAPVQLPHDLVLEAWSVPVAASTADFVRRAFALEHERPARFRELLQAQSLASHTAVNAIQAGDANAFVTALKDQLAALTAWGDEAAVPIVLNDLRPLCATAPSDACFLPSGAGGGDIMLFVSTRPSPQDFQERARALDLQLIPLAIGAQGVHYLDE